jgi:spermidine/putrescine transport system permease protein
MSARQDSGQARHSDGALVSSRQLRHKSLARLCGLLAPPLIWLVAFLFLPYARLFSFSFLRQKGFDVLVEPNLGNYLRFFQGSAGIRPPFSILLDTLGLSLTVTFFTLLISFPLAYFINFKVNRHKQFLYMLVIIPMWVSYIMRAYSWKIILGTNGILNSFLMAIGLIDQPLAAFLYSRSSVTIAMVHIYTPFVLMPIYTALEQIPISLKEASKDLGANRLRTLINVVLPLSLPGIIAGATYAFVLSMGDFLAPSLLGGASSSTMIANIVQQQFGTSNNWPYGAAIGIVILVLVLVILELANRMERRFSALDADRA